MQDLLVEAEISALLHSRDYYRFVSRIEQLVAAGRGGLTNSYDITVHERLLALIRAMHDGRELTVSLPITEKCNLLFTIGFTEQPNVVWWKIDRRGTYPHFDQWWAMQNFSESEHYVVFDSVSTESVNFSPASSGFNSLVYLVVYFVWELVLFAVTFYLDSLFRHFPVVAVVGLFSIVGLVVALAVAWRKPR